MAQFACRYIVQRFHFLPQLRSGFNALRRKIDQCVQGERDSHSHTAIVFGTAAGVAVLHVALSTYTQPRLSTPHPYYSTDIVAAAAAGKSGAKRRKPWNT